MSEYRVVIAFAHGNGITDTGLSVDYVTRAIAQGDVKAAVVNLSIDCVAGAVA